MNEIIATGKTTDEAVESACAELGLSRDEVSVEIIEMPQRKLFGSSPAKVKVTKVEDDFSVKALFSEKLEKPETNQNIHPAQKQFHEEQTKDKPQAQKECREYVEETEEEIEISEIGASATKALQYLKGIATGIGAQNLDYRAVKTERGIKFVLDGEDASLIIGRRGETMDSIQYLCTLIGSRDDENYCKISIDVANYRKKREGTLQALAIREASKVKKTKYNQVLEPMNPYERRIVHSAIQEIENVKSESIGVEPNRRVVISLISGGKQGGGRSNNNNRGGRGGSNRNSGGRRDGVPRDNFRNNDKPQHNSAPQAPQKPAEQTKTSAQKADEYKPANNVPLYGKIKF